MANPVATFAGFLRLPLILVITSLGLTSVMLFAANLRDDIPSWFTWGLIGSLLLQVIGLASITFGVLGATRAAEKAGRD